MGAPKLGTRTLDSFLLHLLNKIDGQGLLEGHRQRKSMKEELRSLEFWRAIIAECLATFFYVFLVCSVSISWTGSLLAHQPNWTVIAMTSGFGMATISQCFGHISGANANPAVTCALFITRKISALRAALYILAQAGGSIAGAALLYGVSVPNHQGALGISMPHESLGPWQIFGVEFVLTFLVVFTIFATLDPCRKSLGSDSLSIGMAYLVCSLTGIPSSGASINPARALGPAFVMNRWKHHWVYWVASITGAMLAGLIYEFIFDTKKIGKQMQDALDDLERDSNGEDHYEEPEAAKGHGNVGVGVGGAGPGGKPMMTYSASGSSHSTSGSNSSNNTGYSSINSRPTGPGGGGVGVGGGHYVPGGFGNGGNATLGPNNSFQHTAVITHDGLYPTNLASNSANNSVASAAGGGGGPPAGVGGQNNLTSSVGHHPVNNYNHLNSVYGSRMGNGIGGGGAHNSLLRTLPNRLSEYGHHMDGSSSPMQVAKF